MEDVEWDTALVFKALTKPTTIMGVDYNYFLLSGLAVMLVFIFAGNFLSLLLFAPLHAMGWLLGKMDPHIFRLIMVRQTVVGTIKNHRLWRCQSYEVG